MSGQAFRYIGAGIAGLAGLALIAAAVVLLARGDNSAPVQIIAPDPPTPAPTVRDIRVQVSGAVMRPGVYTMSEGDRVVDAIAASGGVAADADLSVINLARRVQDEAHYHVPKAGETPLPPETGSLAPSLPGTLGNDSPDAGTLVDLNTATSDGLQSLPGIGPVLAGRIIAHREANGPFASVEDLGDVAGIGPKTLESLGQLVTVSPGQ